MWTTINFHLAFKGWCYVPTNQNDSLLLGRKLLLHFPVYFLVLSHLGSPLTFIYLLLLLLLFLLLLLLFIMITITIATSQALCYLGLTTNMEISLASLWRRDTEAQRVQGFAQGDHLASNWQRLDLKPSLQLLWPRRYFSSPHLTEGACVDSSS